MPAGRPTELNEELKLKIKEYFLESKTLEEIASLIEIPIDTISYWRSTNYRGFRDFLFSLKLERMFNKSVKKLEEIIDIKEAEINTLKLQQDTAKYITETLGKDKGFTKRNELTGKDGEQLIPLQINSVIAEKNNIQQ
jgi:hypothetical protein